MSPPSQRSIRLQQDREKSKDLLRIYGGLLTPKQYAMTSGFVQEGKSFSEIAREHDISRQAVHEVVRSVQRLLTYYESKLLIRERESGGADQVRKLLESLKSDLAKRGVAKGADWMTERIDEALADLDGTSEVTTPVPEPPDGSFRSPKSASGSARRRK